MKINPPFDRPLRFAPIFKEKIWGGHTLGRYLPETGGTPGVGEAWILSGYGSDVSNLRHPHNALRTLSDLLEYDAHSLLGPQADNRLFPLLYKYIDASDKLSVQVHPDDGSAVVNRWGKLGKTECWYVLAAKPDAELILGFNDRYTIGTIADAVRNNKLDALLNHIPVSAGDVLFIPAGTVHAILDGITIYEVQESSDTTFRLYDWGRVDERGHPRQLHIAESLSVLDTGNPGGSATPALSIGCGDGATRHFRCASRFFSLEEFCLEADIELHLPKRTSFSTITVIEGSIDIGEGPHRTHVPFGETVLVPAAANTGIRAVSGGSDTRILVSGSPNLSRDVIAPLRTAGFSAAQIAGLGGINPARNDLLPVL